MDPHAESVFETDFWKDAAARKSWDDLVPGEPRPTIPYLLTLEAVQRYCRSVGDHIRSISTRNMLGEAVTAA
jgi:hypothetical protein